MNTGISIIVPCYNVADLLPRCVDSLLAQTIQLQEIILVNDGSTDRTLEVASAYAQKHSHIRVVTKENQGLPQARKTGLEVATGAYIGFVDSDDWCEPDMYQNLYEAAVSQKADLAVCGYFLSYENGTDKPVSPKQKDGCVLSQEEALHALHCRQGVFPYMWNKLFRRELFEGLKFPHGNFTGEDYVTVIQLIRNAQRIVSVQKPLHHYFQSLSSMSRGGFKPSHLISYEQYQQAADMLISEDPAIRKDVNCYLAVEYMSFVIAMSKNQQYDQKMLSDIVGFVRTNLGGILTTKDMPVFYKAVALAFSVHYKLVVLVYRMIQ